MERMIAVLFALGAACGGAPAPAAPRAADTTVDNAVQRIYLDHHLTDQANWDWYGTAWHLGEGVWITAGHICDDIEPERIDMEILAEGVVDVRLVPATSIRIGTKDANLVLRAQPKSDPKTVPGSWRLGTADDLCVLRSYVAGQHLTLGTAPAFGTRVHYVGFPEGHYGMYEGLYVGDDTHVNGSRNGDGDDDVMFTAPVWGGASGSPLMGPDGLVVGVVVASYRGRPYAYAEPVESLRLLLKEI